MRLDDAFIRQCHIERQREQNRLATMVQYRDRKCYPSQHLVSVAQLIVALSHAMLMLHCDGTAVRRCRAARNMLETASAEFIRAVRIQAMDNQSCAADASLSRMIRTDRPSDADGEPARAMHAADSSPSPTSAVAVLHDSAAQHAEVVSAAPIGLSSASGTAAIISEGLPVALRTAPPRGSEGLAMGHREPLARPTPDSLDESRSDASAADSDAEASVDAQPPSNAVAREQVAHSVHREAYRLAELRDTPLGELVRGLEAEQQLALPMHGRGDHSAQAATVFGSSNDEADVDCNGFVDGVAPKPQTDCGDRMCSEDALLVDMLAERPVR